MTDSKRPIIDASERIRDLNDTDIQVAALLQTAGNAVKSLGRGKYSADQSPEEGAPEGHVRAVSARSAFATFNTEYLHTLQGISARLRRQAYALEEAGILGSEADSSEAQVSNGRQQQAPAKEGPAIGLGTFEVGWLNSRRDDVTRIKEAELWREAHSFLDSIWSLQDGTRA